MKRLSWLLLCACSSSPITGDAGADASSDVVVAQTFSPQALDDAGRLALWLDATSARVSLGSGTSVSTWSDRSKNHNDAVGFGPLPLLEPSVVAGHDAVWFNSTDAALRIADAASIELGTTPFVLIAVTRVRVPQMFWFQKTDAIVEGGSVFLGLELFSSGGGAIGLVDTGGDSIGPSTTLDDGKFHILQFRRTGALLELAVDDLPPQQQAVDPIDVSAIGQPVFIGAPPQTPPPNAPDLEIAEELVIRDALDSDATNVHAYLKQKYSL